MTDFYDRAYRLWEKFPKSTVLFQAQRSSDNDIDLTTLERKGKKHSGSFLAVLSDSSSYSKARATEPSLGKQVLYVPVVVLGDNLEHVLLTNTVFSISGAEYNFTSSSINSGIIEITVGRIDG